MTTISLSTTDTLLDLMPVLPGARKAPQVVATEVGTGAPAQDLGLALRLIPRALRAAMVRRARQRELEEVFERLSETSAHLLADVGITREPEAAEPGLGMTWTRALPAPGLSPTGGPARGPHLGMLARFRRRPGGVNGQVLADLTPDRAEPRREDGRPFWDVPAGWLR